MKGLWFLERSICRIRDGKWVMPKGGPVVRSILLAKITAERERQDAKWGIQRHPVHVWNTILGEEVGEVANAILEDDIEGLKKELIQVAAVALSFAEALEDNRCG